MTAPRECRACGAPLAPEVRWCLRCYAPVLQLTPRERQLPGLPEVEEPPPWANRSPLRDPDARPPTYSRWRAGPTTFGPVGRLTLTLVVLLVFPWDALVSLNPLRLWFMLGYTIFGTYVLRHTWRRERVMVERPVGDGGRSIRARLNARAGRLSRGVDARVLVGAVGALALGGLALAWMAADGFGRYGIAAVTVVALVALFLSWWTES
jgi:hypothetical protein